MTSLTAFGVRPGAELIAVTEIVYTLDLAGYFKFLNAEGERLSGYSCEEARRLRVTEIVAPEFADYVQRQITQTIKERVGGVYELEIITKDGRRVTIETSIHLVAQNGQPVEIHGIALPPVVSWWTGRARCVDPNFRFGTLAF